MKITLNKTNRGFTLIEMIGVLAVIAILAAVLIPKVFEAINNARVNNAAMSCQTIKTAVVDHYAKAGSLTVDVTTTTPVPIAPPAAQYDRILMSEGLLDKPFATRIGDGTTNTTVWVYAISTPPAIAAAAQAGYDLAGNGTNITGSACIEAVISGVTANDAKDLNDRIDGPSLGNATVGAEDVLGRVKYPAYGTAAATNVYIYITHR